MEKRIKNMKISQILMKKNRKEKTNLLFIKNSYNWKLRQESLQKKAEYDIME